MPRYLASISSDEHFRGSIVSVDAPTETRAFDAVCMDRGGDGEITILGTCEEVARLALDRAFGGCADYITEDSK